MKCTTLSGGLALVFALLGFLAAPTAAQEEPAVVKALYDTFAEIGGERPKHKTLTIGADGTITVTDLTMVLSNYQQDGEDIRQEMTVATSVLKDVRELESGLFEVSQMTLKGVEVSISSPQVIVMAGSMPVIEMTGTIIRSPEHIKTPLERWLASQLLARSSSIPLLSIKMDQWSIDAHDMAFNWDGDPKTGLGKWTYTVGRIVLPEEVVALNQGPMSLNDLGYERVEAGLSGQSAIAVAGELIEIGFDMSLLLKDMGAFSFGMELGGIQSGFIAAAQSLREAPDSIDVNGLMAMAQTITIKNFRFRYDDASLVDRVLAYQEKAEGKSREEIIKQALEASDFGMMSVETPELAQQAHDALEAFLNNPGWIQYEINPVQPVPINQLMQLLGTPSEVAKLLQMKITSGPPTKAD